MIAPRAHTIDFGLSCVSVEQDSCVPAVPIPTELAEGFEGKLNPLWQSLSGGQIGSGCGIIGEGKALYFSSAGRREARTAPLDTTNTRSVCGSGPTRPRHTVTSRHVLRLTHKIKRALFV